MVVSDLGNCRSDLGLLDFDPRRDCRLYGIRHYPPGAVDCRRHHRAGCTSDVQSRLEGRASLLHHALQSGSWSGLQLYFCLSQRWDLDHPRDHRTAGADRPVLETDAQRSQEINIYSHHTGESFFYIIFVIEIQFNYEVFAVA